MHTGNMTNIARSKDAYAIRGQPCNYFPIGDHVNVY